MVINVSPLVHIEIVVKEAEAAYQFLHKSFGAEKIQEEFAAFLDSDFARVIHVGLGDVVLEFPLAWEDLIGPENVKPDVPPVHMVNTMDILGFHLELGEKPTDKPLDFLYADIG